MNSRVLWNNITAWAQSKTHKLHKAQNGYNERIMENEDLYEHEESMYLFEFQIRYQKQKVKKFLLNEPI